MTADTSWLESMPEVYDRCLGLAVFAPFGAELALRAADLNPSRVLEPHGSFLFNVWDTLDTSELPAAVYAALAEVLPDNPPDFGARIPHGYADPTRIRADVQAGGLTVEELERIELVGKSPSAAQLAEGFCLGTPLRFQLQERGDLADIVPKVAEVTTRMVGEGPVEGSMAAYVVRARTAL